MNRLIVMIGIFVLSAVLAFGASFTLAAGAKNRFEERHGAYDTGSGQLSMTCGEEFKTIDADGDGSLARGEYEAAYKPSSPATVPGSGTPAFLAFGNKDRNNDFRLTPEEFCAG